MAGPIPIIPSAFETRRDEYSGQGKRPVVFDILAPDRETSLLPDDIKLVLHVNPRTMRLNYQKLITRIQTRGGFVEMHWGDALEDINFEMATGGFVRLYSGLSNIGGSPEGGRQGRRESIAYDRFLDILALFHQNGAIYDLNGDIALQGYLQVSFDGGVHIGWFDTDFTITDSADVPYQFTLTSRFIIDKEELQLRSTILNPVADSLIAATGQPQANQPIGGLYPSQVFGELGADPLTNEVGIRRGSGFTS